MASVVMVTQMKGVVEQDVLPVCAESRKFAAIVASSLAQALATGRTRAVRAGREWTGISFLPILSPPFEHVSPLAGELNSQLMRISVV